MGLGAATTGRGTPRHVNHLTTEGILFELDKAAVLRWLLANEFVDPRRDNIPDLGDKLGLQTWFFNYVRLDAITPFMPVSSELYPITAAVYTLIHSASHAFIGQAAQLCGLDKNPLSEYILPNIPAFLIYCQNVQGVNLGALFNLFEVSFHRWLSSAIESIQTCIFDPLCVDEEKACVLAACFSTRYPASISTMNLIGGFWWGGGINPLVSG